MFSTFASIFIQALLYYGANAFSCKIGLTSGTELYTMLWVLAATFYLYRINNYVETLKTAEKELAKKFLEEINKYPVTEEEKK